MQNSQTKNTILFIVVMGLSLGVWYALKTLSLIHI